MAGASSKPHLIPSQPPPPAERSTAPSKQETSKNPAELQQTIDQLLSQVQLARDTLISSRQEAGCRSTEQQERHGQETGSAGTQPGHPTNLGHCLGSSSGRSTEPAVDGWRTGPRIDGLEEDAGNGMRRLDGSLSRLGRRISSSIARPAILTKELSTGTVVVGDEVVPRSESVVEPELIYQTRNQASIEIKLSIKI
ncbi:hypothetical protein PSTT_05179 [Puccinia striiformis]|uniref:Uncharacterized protein n=1 Tax=Puccinia striiformis TaxID=27350 RepID=A0A2S4VPX3_9BASI|nr:hypothetical protein PSTT_05179 [Puccinia striiformis]